MAAMQAPNLDSEDSREGTAAHWVFAEVLLAFQGKREGPKFCSGYTGRTAPNGVIIDDKMAEGAQVMVDDVLQVANKHGALRSMLIEHRVAMPHIHEQNWGTLDTAIILWKDGRIIAIFLWDYKHGHRDTRAKENLQLIEYAEGLRNELGLDGVQDQQIDMIFRIVQPFCYSNDGPVDEWVCRLSDLRGHANILRDKAYEAFNDPKMSTGKHCRDCPGVGMCTARRKADYNLIDLVNQPYEMDAMNAADLATERQILENGLAAAKERLKAIEDNLTHRIQGGEAGSGLILESKPGRLGWKDGVLPAQAEALASQFGFSIKKDAVKTPTQAIQAAPKEVRSMFEKALEVLAKRPAGALKLINAEDSRVARAFKRK